MGDDGVSCRIICRCRAASRVGVIDFGAAAVIVDGQGAAVVLENMARRCIIHAAGKVRNVRPCEFRIRAVGTGLVRPGASVGQIQIYGGIFIQHGAHKGRITVAERQGYDRILLFPFLCINVAFHHNGDSGIFGHSRSVCRICIDCHFAAVCADGIVVRLNGAAADGSVSVNRKDAFCLTFGMYIHVPGNRQFGTAAVAVDEDGTTVAVAAIEHRLDSAAVVDDEFRIPGTIVPCAAGLAALDGNGPRRQEGVLHCCV